MIFYPPLPPSPNWHIHTWYTGIAVEQNFNVTYLSLLQPLKTAANCSLFKLIDQRRNKQQLKFTVQYFTLIFYTIKKIYIYKQIKIVFPLAYHTINWCGDFFQFLTHIIKVDERGLGDIAGFGEGQRSMVIV